MAASAEQSAAGDVTLIVSGLERGVDQFVSGLARRVTAIGDVPQETDTHCTPPLPPAEPAPAR